MTTLAITPIADYLGHITHPDCDYVDGHLVERNVGEISHSDAQGRTYAFILSNARGFWTGVEARVQVRADRFRVPDVVVVRGGHPAGRIITSPPEVAIGVLSPEDRAPTSRQESTITFNSEFSPSGSSIRKASAPGFTPKTAPTKLRTASSETLPATSKYL